MSVVVSAVAPGLNSEIREPAGDEEPGDEAPPSAEPEINPVHKLIAR